MTEAIWDETVDTDLKEPFFLSKLAARQMIKAGRGGRIVNVLSTEVIRPTGMLAPYGAAKIHARCDGQGRKQNPGQEQGRESTVAGCGGAQPS